ncbi:MAG: DUF6763 family protein [Steroidobacteraceae bacterium]
MSRDFEPEAGQWYEDLDAEEVFKVLSLDPDEELVRIQWLDGEVQEFDLDAWHEMDLELAEEPEGWVDETESDEEEEDEEEELDEEWEDDEDDDWDEDEDDEDDDEDYDDDDDEYRDR